MWGRNEGIENKKTAALILAAIFFLVAAPSGLVGQELPEGLIRILELEAENGGRDLDELLACYESLAERPLNINKASRDELQRLSVLSDFQIESIIEYRKNYGEILSIPELSLVDGFNSSKVSFLLPFITLGPDPDPHKKGVDRWYQKLILRTKRDYAADDDTGIPYYLYAKYRLRYGEKLQIGLTFENDPFEINCPDFTSLHLQMKNVALSTRKKAYLSSAVAGDFSARMGQGLVLWNSFSLSGLGDPSTIFKKESGIVPYTSSDEQNFFRGVGGNFLFGENWALTLFYSYNQLDARTDLLYYYSLPSDGIHVAPSQREARKTLNERVAGGNASFRKGDFKVGVTSAFYSYDKENRRRVTELNKYQIYNGWWGNIALDASFLFRGYRFFAEVAADIGGAVAALAGGILPVSSKFEFSLLLRSYSKKYIAPHAGAYSSSSACAGENGALLNAKWNFCRSFTLSSSLELVDAAENKLKGRLQVDYDAGGGNSAYLKLSYNLNSSSEQKFASRLSYQWKSGSGFSIGAKMEFAWSNAASADIFPWGAAAMVEGGYRSITGKWDAALRGCVYHADQWGSRIYFYERDLPQSFSVPALYGRGVSVYGFLHFKALKWLDLYLKVSEKVGKLQVNLTF